MTNIERKMNKDMASLTCNNKEGIWANTSDLNFDATDEELERFYEHAESCPYHKALVEAETSSLATVLEEIQTAFNIEEINSQDSNLFDVALSSNHRGFTYVDLKNEMCLNALDKDESYINELDVGGILPSHQLDLLQRDIWLPARVDREIFYSSCSYKKIECDFSAGLTEPRVILLYLGLAFTAEATGVDILSQDISDMEESRFRASFGVLASKEQIERISFDFKNHMGVTATHVVDEPMQYCHSNLPITPFRAYRTALTTILGRECDSARSREWSALKSNEAEETTAIDTTFNTISSVVGTERDDDESSHGSTIGSVIVKNSSIVKKVQLQRSKRGERSGFIKLNQLINIGIECTDKNPAYCKHSKRIRRFTRHDKSGENIDEDGSPTVEFHPSSARKSQRTFENIRKSEN